MSSTSPPSSLNRTKVLDLFRGEYITRRENIALIGGIGTGRTHTATALGVAACEQNQRVRFYTAVSLVNELLEAQETHTLSKLENRLMKQDLIILDEVGFVPFSQRGAQMLFAFASQRYLRGSLIVTSNLAPRLTSALLDCLTHRCNVLEFSGESYRFRQSLQRQTDSMELSKN